MEVTKSESRQAIEPLFLSEAQTKGLKIRVGQMNKTDHEGIIREIGRYEINIEESGRMVTILKQEISYLSSPQPVITVNVPLPAHNDAEASSAKPNIQQEFLDKAIRENQALTLFLMNGQRIKATIEAYDNFTILLKESGRQHLYYKHSITTINR